MRVAEYTFRAQVANRWRRGNMFILGDAAHLTPPFIGQGLCAGLRDAMNLAWKLAGVVNGWLPESVLDTYEQERIPHARYMIRFALAMGTAMTAGGEVGQPAPPSGGSAPASDPRGAGEDRRQHDARVAQQCIGTEITRTTATGGPVVPESRSARRQTVRRGRRRQVRGRHVRAAQPVPAGRDGSPRRRRRDGASRHRTGPLAAGRTGQGRGSATGSDGAVRRPQSGRSLPRGTGFRATRRYRR